MLRKILEKLNEKLPGVKANEVVVGLMSSGTVLSAYLALIRGTRYNYSVYDKFGNYEEAFSFSEGHRNDSKHYLYGIMPGDNIIIIEDEVWSGNGMLQLVTALRAYGANVCAAATVIEVVSFGARELLKKETGLELISLVSIEVS